MFQSSKKCQNVKYPDISPKSGHFDIVAVTMETMVVKHSTMHMSIFTRLNKGKKQIGAKKEGRRQNIDENKIRTLAAKIRWHKCIYYCHFSQKIVKNN